MRFGGLIAAVIFAAIAAVVVLRMSGGSSQAPTASQPVPEAKTVNVYVATKPLPIGTTIGADDMGIQPWPEQLMVSGFVVADGKTNLVGMVTRAPLQQNEPIMTTAVANPNDPNFLAGELPKGMRVVTIPLNETDGIAGFVFPGDHVDLIYTHDVDKWITPPAALVVNTSASGHSSERADITPEKTKITVSETLLTNVKVVAIDQRSSGAGAVDTKGNLIVPRSATVMVSQSDSQRVRLAQHTGTLSLALRSLADRESADPLILTNPSDVTQSKDGLENTGAAQQANTTIKIVRGAPKDKEFESGGPAVSRGLTGATGAIGAAGANPISPVTNGGSVVNPGLAAY